MAAVRGIIWIGSGEPDTPLSKANIIRVKLNRLEWYSARQREGRPETSRSRRQLGEARPYIPVDDRAPDTTRRITDGPPQPAPKPIPPRPARNNNIESRFDVGRRFRCTIRIDCGQLHPDTVIRPDAGEWHPRMPPRLDDEELSD